jgi:hypothetical protein
LRVPIRTIIVFFAIGIPLILLWLYVDEKSKQQQQQQQQKNKKINNIISMQQEQQQPCMCSICKHEQAGTCFELRCECCLMMKGDSIIGHSINPIQ